MENNQKSAFIALVGRPNTGKSSIMNRLLGQKIAIVSDKPQTTRTRIMGVLSEGENQFVFIDTPGLHKPRTSLGEKMVKSINSSMTDVDGCLLVVDATNDISVIENNLVEQFSKRKLKVILALNKIDLIKSKQELLPLILKYSALFDFDAIIPVSAITGEGFDVLLKEILKFAVAGVHMFSDDTLTDQPERVIASEIVREKLLQLLDKEIPHGIAVQIENYSEREDSGILDIECTIYCEKDSHKSIIIGKNGSMLKRAGTLARHDMETFFDCKVNLQCWVKIRENWRNRPSIIHNFGLD